MIFTIKINHQYIVEVLKNIFYIKSVHMKEVLVIKNININIIY